MGVMDIWYAHLSEQELMSAIKAEVGTEKGKAPKKEAKGAEKNAKKTAAKARTRDSLQALSKLGELVDGRYRIVSQPPIVVPIRDLSGTYAMTADELRACDS